MFETLFFWFVFTHMDGGVGFSMPQTPSGQYSSVQALKDDVCSI